MSSTKTLSQENRLKRLKNSGDIFSNAQDAACAYAAAFLKGDKDLLENSSQYLWDILYPALYAIAKSSPKKDFETVEDIVLESYGFVLEACLDFNPKKGGFDSWWRGRLERHLRARYSSSRGGRGWDRVSRYTYKVIEDFKKSSGQEPGFELVKAEVFKRCENWAKRRVKEDASKKGIVLNSAQLDEAVQAKLVKDGTAKALRDLGRIVSVLEKELSLDALLGEDDMSLYDILEYEEQSPTWVDAVSCMFNKEESCIMWRRNGEGNDSVSWRDIAKDMNMDWMAVKAIYEKAIAKPKMPHAQWVWLGDVSKQVVNEEHSKSKDQSLVRFRQRSFGKV